MGPGGPVNPRIGSLFTGTGGLDLAVQSVFGGDLVWVCDNHPSAVALLSHHYPEVPNLGDIRQVDWPSVARPDVVTAGFPCQDISNAGARKGIGGVQSGLWSVVADAVRVLRPQVLVLENVSALRVRGLDRVAADLAAIRYDLRWTCLRASTVGAPHHRDRWFGLATPYTVGCSVPYAARDGRDEGWSGPTWLVGGHDAALGGRLPVGPSLDWRRFTPAVERWEAILGRPPPVPIEPGRQGRPVLSPRFVEWVQGLPEGRTVDVPGLSRTARLHLLGNGVVPQQAAHALDLLLCMDIAVDAA